MIMIVFVYGLLVKKYSYDIYQHHRHIMHIMLAFFILLLERGGVQIKKHPALSCNKHFRL